MASMLAMHGIVGCNSSATGPMVTGELGNGDFIFLCAGAADPTCSDDFGTVRGAFPSCIVEGGTFDLEYRLRDDSALSRDFSSFLRLQPASAAYLGPGSPFEARQTGEAAVLVRDDEQVVDLLHLRIASHTGVAFDADTGGGSSSIELRAEESRTIVVTPLVDGCSAIGGTLTLDASSAAPEIVSVQTGGRVTLTGVALGVTTVSVRLGALSRELMVSVVEGPPPDPDTSTSGIDTDTATDGDTDAATDGDTDTDTDGGGDTDTTGAADTDTTSGSTSDGTSSSTGGEG